MNAREIVDNLLEGADPDDFDPLEYAYDTVDPQPYSYDSPEFISQFTRALRDELVERGWRHIRLRPIEGNKWEITAGWIDERFRAKYYVMGARVTGPPPEDFNLGGRVASSLKGGLNRVGCKLLSLEWPGDFVPVHDGLDLENLPDDFEDDPGDWQVAAIITFTPKPKFWSNLRKASPMDLPLPPTPRKPKNLLTPEQQAQRDEEHRQRMQRLRTQMKDTEQLSMSDILGDIRAQDQGRG